MKTLFWKSFYRLKFGSNYKKVVDAATITCKGIGKATTGRGLRFDSNGNALRENHRPVIQSANKINNHPLIRKYQFN